MVCEMKHSGLLLVAILLVLATGCATHYVVVLNNGNVTTSRGKPKMVSQYVKMKGADGKEQKVLASEYYEFMDVSGEKRQVPPHRIAQIYPASDSGDENVFYIPNDYQMPKAKKKSWFKWGD